MQQILPIFPSDLKMVNFRVGFKQEDDFVHYFVNGMPVYCHQVDDKNGYHYVLGTLVNLGNKHISRQKLCLPGMVDFWVNIADGLLFQKFVAVT